MIFRSVFSAGASRPGMFPSCSSVSCRNEAASRFSRCAEMCTSSSLMAGFGSSHQAICGRTRAGWNTQCSPSARCPALNVNWIPLGRTVSEEERLVRGAALFTENPSVSCQGRRGLRRRAARSHGDVLEQPYEYTAHELVEPDWRRLPGFADVTVDQWRSAQWQRSNSVKNLRQLRGVYGDLLDESFYIDVEADQAGRATMSLLLPPQMLNTMVPHQVPTAATMLADPVRRYMLPVASDRLIGTAASHPYATRDSLHEHEMWTVEGLTHRYPTKVLTELLTTCPQYCGHCTRMDLVGNSTPAVDKLRFELKPVDRQGQMLDYLRRTPGVRDVVVSGGDVANMAFHNLEAFVSGLLEIESVRDIRLASKALMGLPQHWLQDEVIARMTRLATTARERGVSLAVHTHVNAAQSVTPLVAEAARAMLAAGVRDVRNQGVLMRGVNDSAGQLLDLCFALLDGAGVTPYYIFMGDMIPSSEHWRVSLAQAQALQHDIMGYLPGFATPRIAVDVPYVGKRWVHQVAEYDRERGISYWTKNYRTGIERTDLEALDRRYVYYDPIDTLPSSGQKWWAELGADVGDLARV